MASPKSPTFSQSMFARKTQPSIDNISAPIMIPVRGLAQRNGSLSYAPSPGNSLTLSSASSGRKKINRRSLSADGLWVANVPQQIKDLQNAVYADNLTYKSQYWKQTSMDTLVSKHTASEDSLAEDKSASAAALDNQDQGAGRQSEVSQELRPADPDFYQSSVEFLSMHGHTQTSGDWVNRNKRKTLVPKRRQSESNLLSNVAKATRDANTLHVDEELSPRGGMEDVSERASMHGPEGRCNEQEQATAAAGGVDTEDQSLLSSVDSVLMPRISTPTQYYDSTETRKLLRTYLTSEGRRFEEMVEFGFPGSGLVESNGSTDHNTTGNGRFLTLRLTLTPWHAREDEAKLYGPDDDDVEKHAPIKGMVNKFLSRTSAILSCSPPRTFSPSSTPDSKAVSSKDYRPTSHTFDNASGATRGPRDATDLERPAVTSWRVETSSGEALGGAAANDPRMSQSSPPKRVDSANRMEPPPKSLSRSRPGPKKDRGFRILDPSTLSISQSTIRSVRSAEFLKSDPEFCASPPSTPSPTAVFNHLQQQQIPRKGSLSSLSLSESASLRRPIPEAIVGPTGTSAPIIPPRRKASSPAILLNCDVSALRNPKQQPPVFTPNSPATFSPLNKARQGSLQPNAPFQELQDTAIMTSAESLSTSPPSPSPITSTTGSTPIPIPSAKRLQSQQHPWTDHHVYGAPSARVPRTPLKNKRSDLSESTPEPMILTPRHDLLMTMTTTPS
ncbi:hypothetical protein EC968_010620 [Mortierella alpina]|nr:hypothetical protein EC968_010620 [Mortierella alpina]